MVSVFRTKDPVLGFVLENRFLPHRREHHYHYTGRALGFIRRNAPTADEVALPPTVKELSTEASRDMLEK